MCGPRHVTSGPACHCHTLQSRERYYMMLLQRLSRISIDLHAFTGYYEMRSRETSYPCIQMSSGLLKGNCCETVFYYLVDPCRALILVCARTIDLIGTQTWNIELCTSILIFEICVDTNRCFIHTSSSCLSSFPPPLESLMLSFPCLYSYSAAS